MRKPIINSAIIIVMGKSCIPEALSEYSKAIELVPQEADYFRNRGDTYRLMGKYEEALQDLNRAVELDPGSPYAYNARGHYYGYAKKQYTEAISEYSKAIELNPQEAVFYSNRGDIYRLMGRYDEALQDLNRGGRAGSNISLYL